jgi:DNA-binding transcriptional LysR family regulator
MDFTTTDQVIDLVEEGADVAIRIGELKDSSLVARKLAPLRRVICGSPTYLAAHGTPRRPEDLAAHNCLTFRFHAASSLWRPGADLWRMKGPDEAVVEVAVSGRLRANGADVLLDAARAGLGLVLMPIWMVGDDIRGGRLRPVLSQYRVSPTTIDAAIYAVFPANRHLSPKVRVFIDYLAERFRDVPYLSDEVPVPPRSRTRARRTAAAGLTLQGQGSAARR